MPQDKKQNQGDEASEELIGDLNEFGHFITKEKFKRKEGESKEEDKKVLQDLEEEINNL